MRYEVCMLMAGCRNSSTNTTLYSHLTMLCEMTSISSRKYFETDCACMNTMMDILFLFLRPFSRVIRGWAGFPVGTGIFGDIWTELFQARCPRGRQCESTVRNSKHHLHAGKMTHSELILISIYWRHAALCGFIQPFFRYNWGAKYYEIWDITESDLGLVSSR